jgi:hypothetical protein
MCLNLDQEKKTLLLKKSKIEEVRVNREDPFPKKEPCWTLKRNLKKFVHRVNRQRTPCPQKDPCGTI